MPVYFVQGHYGVDRIECASYVQADDDLHAVARMLEHWQGFVLGDVERVHQVPARFQIL